MIRYRNAPCHEAVEMGASHKEGVRSEFPNARRPRLENDVFVIWLAGKKEKTGRRVAGDKPFWHAIVPA
jgi:hypothetical protein